ncbi:sodium:solute symporter [Litchfieldella anticariensis FP35 = DSM 16096]|uniref:Sodium:solute symporter n=1 Tax=Litchfieldella anticariensis (strain DSM 16096 / CECT 5854 / CIP 108499 / LMG 22089 / FP35) TaxID=1121939 RepID=S2KG68_LITA3|nr:sodium:solute symporter [Halomonas anticariensis]EPC01132.1 sodium:solute symporter [Halomonas anticariensis FP35 = DSM 16096]
MTLDHSLLFWGFLLVYGGLMYWLSPRSHSAASFYRGADARGNPVGQWSLTASIFISWIFAKSVTNAANLGEAYGVVGGLAYATYWLSIPLAGYVIYLIRTQTGAESLTHFLTSRFGRLAALSFGVAILIRLYNEVWSNTAVVGGYFGMPGEPGYYLAALLFTAFTLAYSLKGGLRSSIFTDMIQAVLFVFFVGAVLFLVMPGSGPDRLLTTGSFTLGGGMDLLLVAGLQIFSYPFHDPVLTDRGFVNREKTMLKSFAVAGLLGFVAVFAFSLLGVHAQLQGIEGMGNTPAAVGQALGLAALAAMTIIMMTSAGSTLDSTFTSFAKSLAVDLPRLAGRLRELPSMRVGAVVMVVFAILGNLPMFAGTDILKATTVSGTMVMGLAPVFLFYRLTRWSPWSFHLSFWSGVGLGILLAAGLIPEAWRIGDGPYGLLLGVNAWGLLLCTAGFFLPLVLRLIRSPRLGEAR